MTDIKTTLRPLVRIVDDNPGMLESLAFMLGCEGYDTATYGSAADFLRGDRPSRPGCLVLDVKMPGMSGIELQQLLNGRRSGLPIVFLTAYGSIGMAVDTIHEGAADFLQKPVVPEKLLQAVARAVALDIERRGPGQDAAGDARQRLDALTPREKEVLAWVAKGLSSRETARRIGLSQRTVEHHRAGGMAKLRIKSISDLAVVFASADGKKR